MKEIHLFDLPEELRVKIKDDYRKNLFDMAQNKAGDTKKLAETIKENPRTIRRWKSITNCAIRKLKERGLLKVFNKKKATNKGFLPALCVVTERGLKTSYVEGVIK